MKKKILIVFAVVLAMAGQANAAWWWPPTNDTGILPQNPTSLDIVTITLSGEWPDSCIPNGSAISKKDNSIYFDVILDYPPGTACLTIICGWARTEFVGPLSPGTYKVYARPIGDPWVPGTYMLMTEFVVDDDVCECDLNHDGRCNMQDWLLFGHDWGRTDCSPGNPCECDLNQDGRCDMQDWLLFGEDWGRTDCLTCE